MQVVIATSVRLFGEGIAACFRQHSDIVFQALAGDIQGLRQIFQQKQVDVALIDVTQGINLEEVRILAVEFPKVVLVALGLQEQKQSVIRCGRAGFSGYVARDASVEHMCQTLRNAVAGKLACSAEISQELMRALFLRDTQTPEPAKGNIALTKREGEVLHLIGSGKSNKEIARDLNMSVATVKHHVHNVLQKLNLPRRSMAMRRVREAPWLANPPLSVVAASLE